MAAPPRTARRSRRGSPSRTAWAGSPATSSSRSRLGLTAVAVVTTTGGSPASASAVPRRSSQPGRAGQVEVEQDERRAQAVGELGGGGLGGRRLGDPEALRREVAGEDRPEALVVLDRAGRGRGARSRAHRLDRMSRCSSSAGPQRHEPDAGIRGEAARGVEDLGRPAGGPRRRRGGRPATATRRIASWTSRSSPSSCRVRAPSAADPCFHAPTIVAGPQEAGRGQEASGT